DQKFNLLVGRALQAEYGQEPQCIMTMPLLEGLDGVEKMSKTKGNYVSLTEPANDMFAKLMSISDDLMWKYFDLLSFRSEPEIARLRTETSAGRNPRDAKVALAKEIAARFHGPQAADAAEVDFDLRARGGIPADIAAVELTGAPLGIGAVLKQAGLAPSTSEATRLIEGGGVRVDGGVVSDRALTLPSGTFVVQVGKRRFARVTLR
ncbi:MAG: tyrosine--tRNA ligase, partial [Caldimonas sp.]